MNRVRLVGGRIKQRVEINGHHKWRTACWCSSHGDLAWRFGDGSVQCMFLLVAEEGVSDDCVVRALDGTARAFFGDGAP